MPYFTYLRSLETYLETLSEGVSDGVSYGYMYGMGQRAFLGCMGAHMVSHIPMEYTDGHRPSQEVSGIGSKCG